MTETMIPSADVQQITGNSETRREYFSEAFLSGQIWPGFQPIVDLDGNTVAGFEVLGRWEHPQAGSISPVDFIPMLSESGALPDYTEMMITAAASEAATWEGDFTLSFNVSMDQLSQHGTGAQVTQAVEAGGFSADRVTIEVTENEAATHRKNVDANIHELLAQGMSLSIDDFGTGHSNFSRLASYPFSQLKIDARFVRGIGERENSNHIASSLITLGNSLGLQVVAEGVESADDAKMLAELGGEFGQGWHFGKVLPANGAAELAAQKR